LAELAGALRPDADPTGLAVALLAALAWVITGWLILAVTVALASRAPGAVGLAAARIAERISPALVRRMVGGATVVGVVLCPLAVPTLASAAPASSVGSTPCSAGLPSLDRIPLPCSTPAPSPDSSSALDGDRAAVTVRPGDTLWSVAAAELRRDGLDPTPRAVAARWPAWWQANRTEIGADPNLIHPGTSLVTPTAAPEGTR
jgi:nucleoid-associated protein YgaU